MKATSRVQGTFIDAQRRQVVEQRAVAATVDGGVDALGRQAMIARDARRVQAHRGGDVAVVPARGARTYRLAVRFIGWHVPITWHVTLGVSMEGSLVRYRIAGST